MLWFEHAIECDAVSHYPAIATDNDVHLFHASHASFVYVYERTTPLPSLPLYSCAAVTDLLCGEVSVRCIYPMQLPTTVMNV